jgi:hypothetical protein
MWLERRASLRATDKAAQGLAAGLAARERHDLGAQRHEFGSQVVIVGPDLRAGRRAQCRDRYRPASSGRSCSSPRPPAAATRAPSLAALQHPLACRQQLLG